MRLWQTEIRERLATLSLDPACEAALIEELGQHLDDCYHEALENGQTPEDARRFALAELNGAELLVQELRAMRAPAAQTPIVIGANRRSDMVHELGQDLRFGLRMMWKTPVATAIAILSLAIGVGANTAIFSLIDATMLRMLPVKDPQRLALFYTFQEGKPDYAFSLPAFDRFRENQLSFSGLIATSSLQRMQLQTAEGVETVEPERVTGNYFSALGVPAALGRTLTEADDNVANPQAVVVLSHDFWRRRFGADPSVIGKTITLDDYPFTIVGVAPAGFRGVEVGRRPDFWSPIQAIPLAAPDRAGMIKDEGYSWLRVIGRLQPGASLARAQAGMALRFKQQMTDFIDKQPRMSASERRRIETTELGLEPGAIGWTPLRRQFKRPLLILMIIVSLVLLVACANIAGLLLARGMARRKEISVRLALGASRARLLKQLLTESLLLAMFGGAVGILIAILGVGALTSYLPQQNTALNLDIHLDWRMLGFTLGASILTGLAFGLAPAWQATRLDVNSALKDQPGASLGGARWTLHKGLILAQVALSLFLLVGAGLFIRSLQNLKAIDLGFDREHLLQFSLLPGKGYTAAQNAALYRQLLAKLEALPGVRAASLSSFSLISGNRMRSKILAPGFVAQNEAEALSNTLSVGPNYFAAMGIPLLAGREFGPQDQRTAAAPGAPEPPNQSPLVAVINQSMARRYFGDENPIGKQFRTDKPENPPIEVVGLVRDAVYVDLRETPPPTYYVAWFQRPGKGPLSFQLRTTGDAAEMTNAVRRVAREVDPKIQPLEIRTMNERIDEFLVQERSIAQLAGFFSLFAVLLSCLGLYGAMSQAVSRRTREIGVRMALGAERRDVVQMVLRESMSLVAFGLLVGLLAAVAASRLVAGLLYGVTPFDLGTLVFSVFTMLVVTALAAYLPARRASQVDPLKALRTE